MQNNNPFTITLVKVIPRCDSQAIMLDYLIPCCIQAFFKDGLLHFLPGQEIVWEKQPGSGCGMEKTSVKVIEAQIQTGDDITVYTEEVSPHLTVEYWTNVLYPSLETRQ